MEKCKHREISQRSKNKFWLYNEQKSILTRSNPQDLSSLRSLHHCKPAREPCYPSTNATITMPGSRRFRFPSWHLLFTLLLLLFNHHQAHQKGMQTPSCSGSFKPKNIALWYWNYVRYNYTAEGRQLWCTKKKIIVNNDYYTKEACKPPGPKCSVA